MQSRHIKTSHTRDRTEILGVRIPRPNHWTIRLSGGKEGRHQETPATLPLSVENGLGRNQTHLLGLASIKEGNDVEFADTTISLSTTYDLLHVLGPGGVHKQEMGRVLQVHPHGL